MAEELNEGTSKRQKAVALEYAQGDRAPRVVAAGAGEIAKRILKLAEENNIPVRRDDSLVEILSKLAEDVDAMLDRLAPVAPVPHATMRPSGPAFRADLIVASASCSRRLMLRPVMSSSVWVLA